MLKIDLEDVSEVIDLHRFIESPILNKRNEKHERTVAELVHRIRNNTRRYVQLFAEVVDDLMPPPTRDISYHDEAIDVILHQRQERNSQSQEEGRPGFPPELLRR